MKRSTLLAIAMVAVMSMASVNAQAQGRHGGPGGHGGHGGPGGHYSEMYGGGHHGGPGFGGHHDGPGFGGHHDGPGFGGHHDGPGYGGYASYGHARPHRDYCGYRPGVSPRWGRDGYLCGWEGRVRCFDEGYYGYYRDNRWYYYNTYFEPDYYYAQPINTFCSYTYQQTATAAAVGATVGAMVSLMMR